MAMEQQQPQPENNEESEKWSIRGAFIMAGLGYVIGPGNIWRFPYICGQNGGAPFLIAYLILAIFVGFPCVYMQCAMGQYASMTAHVLERRMCPIFSGIPYSVVLIGSLYCICFNVVTSWLMYYVGVSFQSPLPWTDCSNAWNNLKCRNPNCFNATCISLLHSQCYTRISLNTSDISIIANDSTMTHILDSNPINSSSTILQRIVLLNGEHGESPAVQYFYNHVLAKSDDLAHIGHLKWDLVLCLFIAWIILFLCLIKGIKSSGKILYFTASFHVVIFSFLLLRMPFLDGANSGIKFFFEPDISKLAQPRIWVDAANQIFFSMGLGEGALTTLAGYNHFHDNILRNSAIIAAGDTVTSLIAGVVIFSTVGFLAKHTWNSSVSQIAAEGTALIFTAYPDAISRLHVPQFWSIIFFLMIFLLAFFSMLVNVQVIVNVVIYLSPSCKTRRRKAVMIGTICAFFFLCGLPMCTTGTVYILTLLEKFASGWALIVTCLFKVIMVSYVYGAKRFLKNIQTMLRISKPYKRYIHDTFFTISWCCIVPVALTGALTLKWINSGIDRTKIGSYIFPMEADIIGWCIVMFCVGLIPIAALCEFASNRYHHQRLHSLIEPTDDWRSNEPQSINETSAL